MRMSPVWDKLSPGVAGMEREESGARTVCPPAFLSIFSIRNNQTRVLNLVRILLWQCGVLFVSCFLSKPRRTQGVRDEIMHGKHFPYFCTKMCMGQGQEIFEGGEIHSKHGILKG